jgi:outer membrane scaffolding protein for murein synthesis (MipA/OmpV family)
VAGPAVPKPDPLWEVGLFAGATRLPHYRGSDEYSLYAIPAPFVIYRGKWIQASREGVNGLLLRGKRWETLVSLNGNPPVPGSNDARDGLEDLDPLIEFGPGVRWYFAGRDPELDLYLLAAVRGVNSVQLEGGLEAPYRGLRGGLNLVCRRKRPFGLERWTAGVNLGVDLADEPYNSYLYDVPASGARPDRPAYDAQGGYGGFSTAAFVTRQIGERLWLSGYARWDNLTGAAASHSPLLRAENNLVLSAALVWRIAESRRPAYDPLQPAPPKP